MRKDRLELNKMARPVNNEKKVVEKRNGTTIVTN